MRDDDDRLQILYEQLLCTFSWWDKWKLRSVHVYPSLQCSYSLDNLMHMKKSSFRSYATNHKRRIFVRMRNDVGEPYADCVLLHVLLHEIAHVVNQRGFGHDAKFQRIQAPMSQLHRHVHDTIMDNLEKRPSSSKTSHTSRKKITLLFLGPWLPMSGIHTK